MPKDPAASRDHVSRWTAKDWPTMQGYLRGILRVNREIARDLVTRAQQAEGLTFSTTTTVRTDTTTITSGAVRWQLRTRRTQLRQEVELVQLDQPAALPQRCALDGTALAEVEGADGLWCEMGHEWKPAEQIRERTNHR